jgi:DNA-binding NarL/FixJ family response regulator
MRNGITRLYGRKRDSGPYLRYVADNPNIAPDDLATLFGASDLAELVAVVGLLEKRLSTWLLLFPAGGRQAVMMMDRQQEVVDPLAGSPISHIPVPGASEPVSNDAPWAKSLLNLLSYQFQVADTGVLAPVWWSGSLLAITGISGTGVPANTLAQGMVLAVRRLHEIDTLRREVEGHRFLLKRAGKAILLALGTGQILNGTEAGLAVLKELHAKPGIPGSYDTLPVALRRSIEAGAKHVIQDDVRAIISQPNLLPTCTTAGPLVAIEFSRKVIKRMTKDSLSKLTRAERRVYDHLVCGDRNKEIANKLGISEHTARHHVSAVLAKLRYPDRVLLIAGAAAVMQPEVKVMPPNKMKVPPLQAVAELPTPKMLVVGKRKVSEKS